MPAAPCVSRRVRSNLRVLEKNKTRTPFFFLRNPFQLKKVMKEKLYESQHSDERAVTISSGLAHVTEIRLPITITITSSKQYASDYSY